MFVMGDKTVTLQSLGDLAQKEFSRKQLQQEQKQQ